MEGVGARLGRSSTRYGPATVFNGPVRKWKKKWVHVSSSSSSSSASTAAANSHSTNSHSQNGISNGNNGSHLVLYKWTPITSSQNNNSNNTNNNADKKQDNTPPPDEPPRRKFKYIPIAVLEEQKNEKENEANENIEDDIKLNDADQNAAEQATKGDVFDEKPDINDVPMEESQGNNQVMQQDLNESTLDLSLGLTARDNEHSKSNQKRNGQ